MRQVSVPPEVLRRLSQRYAKAPCVSKRQGAREGLSGKCKSLLVMFTLFSLITAAQYYAAVLAHSVALMADCASMAVDALSYLGNMVAECTREKRCRAVLGLIMSGASLMLLAYFTAVFFATSVAVTRSDTIVSASCACLRMAFVTVSVLSATSLATSSSAASALLNSRVELFSSF